MPFPRVDRVYFKLNPLEKVICQIRFPPLLRIDSEIPSLFQEHIRSKYPQYSKKIEYRTEIPLNLGQISTELNQEATKTWPGISSQANANHEFLSENGEWSVNLTRTFIAVSTSKYTRWEKFRERFQEIFHVLNELYVPPFFTRVGLRYVDVFQRTKLGLKNSHWKDLLQPYVLGLLSSEVESHVKNYISNSEISLGDGESLVRIATSFAQRVESNEQVFIVDSDFHNERKSDLKMVDAKLDFLNSRATRLIQWMITPKLFNAMEPTKI